MSTKRGLLSAYRPIPGRRCACGLGEKTKKPAGSAYHRENDHGSDGPHSQARITMNEVRPGPAIVPLIVAFLQVRVRWPFNRSKAIRQRMPGLVKHDVVRAGYGHHDHESVPVILNFAAELRSFALQFSDRV